jgi:alginate O-acetyltransferase complex protein AlgJ
LKTITGKVSCLVACLLFIPCLAPGSGQGDHDQFRQACSNLAAKAEQSGSIAVAGKDNWLFLSSELRHLGAGQFWGEAASRASRAAKPEAADPLPAILDFSDQLKKAGVELILVPVPPKAVVYPEMLPGLNNPDTTARLDKALQEFYGLLRAKGVKVMDLAEFFIGNKNDPHRPLYCRTDSHWSGSGCVLAAGKISSEIRALVGENPGGKQAFTSNWQAIEIGGDLRPALNNADAPREKLSIRKISRPGSGEPVASGAGGRVILLGDSHNLVFHAGDDMLSSGAGLPDQLAFELGEEVELVAVRGSGATPARVNLMRRAQQMNNYWANKKCVIWCFSAREFTESDGWRKVPVAPKKADEASE